VFDNSKAPVLVDYFLDPGYIYVTLRPAQISAVLGSCVAVCIHDRKRNISGMNHFQYPQVTDPSEATARYGNVATLALIRMMAKEGSKLKHMEAQIFGGANNAKMCPKNIGRENVMAARKVLARERVALVSEDVGGEKGRKIVFDTFRNQVAVVRVDNIRKGDWYPYQSDR
jgi:chemotaxis protein CheD